MAIWCQLRMRPRHKLTLTKFKQKVQLAHKNLIRCISSCSVRSRHASHKQIIQYPIIVRIVGSKHTYSNKPETKEPVKTYKSILKCSIIQILIHIIQLLIEKLHIENKLPEPYHHKHLNPL